MTGQKEIVGFLESCRLCLRNHGTFNIFSDEALVQDIKEFTGITVLLSYNLPQFICRECSDILKNVKQLRDIAARNDVSMKNLVNCGTQEVPQSEHNRQVFVDETSSSVDYSTDVIDAYGESFTVKIEDVTVDEDPLCSDQNALKQDSFNEESTVSRTHKITVRSDLFSEPEVKPPSDMQLIKHELNIGPGIRKPKYERDSNFRCHIRGKQFLTWKKIYCHMRLHNRSFACTLDGCEKKFASKSDLEKHFRIHTGVKPYECELCSRRFTQNVTLKYHREAVHKIVMPANHKSFHAS